MTREEMMDSAVRASMAPVTMRNIVRAAAFAERIRRDCVPWQPDWPEPDNTEDIANSYWWHGTVADKALVRFPGRVKATRRAFRVLDLSR